MFTERLYAMIYVKVLLIYLFTFARYLKKTQIGEIAY